MISAQSTDGIFSANLTVQRSFDNETICIDVNLFKEQGGVLCFFRK